MITALNMLLRGFKFGMLLQLVVGQMCLLVFSTSSTDGLVPGLMVVSAVTLVDAIYITLAGFGVSAFLGGRAVRKALVLAGGLILIAFGFNTLAGAFGLRLLPDVNLFESYKGAGYFMRGFILCASNPLTIIFWGGVFSSQVARERLTGLQLAQFGAGCALSTAVALGCVALLGSALGSFLPDAAIRALNALVGCILVFMGARLMLDRRREAA